MPSITKDQHDHCKLAQFYEAHGKYGNKCKKIKFDNLVQINNVNLKVLSNKSNKRFLTGSTPLHIACLHKNIEVFDSLLERGADFTAINKNGETALHRAAYDMLLKPECFRTTNNDVENELIDSVLTAHVDLGIADNPRSASQEFCYGLTHFHIACAVGNLTAIKFFLDSGVSVEETVDASSYFYPGYTALHFASMFFKYEAARLLLQYGADLRVADAKGLTSLHVITKRIMDLKVKIGMASDRSGNSCLDSRIVENQKLASFFLNADQKLDIDSMGFSKLHAACTLSDSSLAKRFLKDVDVNSVISMDSRMWPGYTALHFAVQSNIKTAKLLIKNGADIGAQDVTGVTPLDLCLENYNLVEFYNILLVVPAFKDIKFSDNQTKLMDFLNAIKSSSAIETFLQSVPKDLFLSHDSALWPGYHLSHLLVHFSRGARFDVEKLFLNFGDVMLTQQDSYGRSPLHLAFYQGKGTIVDLFFKHRLVKADVIDNNGLSHLHIASERENTGLVESLLLKGANVNVTYKGKELILGNYWYFTSVISRGSTPLHIAVSKRCKKLIKTLLKCGADTNATDINGITPMHQFMYFKSDCMSFDPTMFEELEDLMLSSRNLINVVSHKSGLSHLHAACFFNKEKAVENLLNLGADVNAVVWSTDTNFTHCGMTSFEGYTPLHFAVANENINLINLLLKRGADILIKKPDGMTLLYDALKRRPFQRTDIAISKTRFYIPLLEKDPNLCKRVEIDSGLTLLHIACYLGEAELIQSLLTDLEVNVNAQIHSNLPIWPSATPLHILIECKEDRNDLNYLAKLLLERGANVMLANDKGDTPLHKAWSNWFSSKNTQDYDLLRLLLFYHEDFNFNPVNEEGISHFHLACYVSESSIVENCLKGGVDVNLPVDHINQKMTFQTPLRFMLESLRNTEARLQTIDVLIKYGADVNTQDENGLTPFLKVASCNSPRELFFEKLYEVGVDIYCTNLLGESALEILFESRNRITNEELQFFFGHPNFFNTYNPLYGIGIISMAVSKKHAMRDHRYIFDAMMGIATLFTVDRMKRTPIHNLVANYETDLTTEEYAHYIEGFIKMGYDVDAQDSEGTTALHLAAYFCNRGACLGLLLSGADITITDKRNRTVTSILSKHRPRFCKNVLIPKESNIPVTDMIRLHLIAMLLCNLEINAHDFKLINFIRLINPAYRSYSEIVMKELEEIKLVSIGSLKINDFLSETGAVASRPSMASQTDRETVERFFESSDIKRYPLLRSVLKLQYRKTLNRLKLIEPATESLKHLVGDLNGFCLPDLCCRIILRFLSNTEVKKLIISVSEDKTID